MFYVALMLPNIFKNASVLAIYIYKFFTIYLCGSIKRKSTKPSVSDTKVHIV